MPMFKRKLEHKVPLDYNINEPFSFGEDVTLPSNAQFIEDDDDSSDEELLKQIVATVNKEQ